MNQEQEYQEQYMNDGQLECFYTGAHTSIIPAGRRFGKTDGIVAPWSLRNLQYMPGSSGGIVCSTFQQALTRTLPGTMAALERLGFKRNIHYYVGIKPPKKAGFPKPVRAPLSYDRVVAWYNGSLWYLISQDVPGSANSLTLQYILGDEAKLLNFDKLKDEVFPANGGFPGPWRDCPWLNSMLFVSDMPTTKRGSWFLNYEDKATPEAIEAIKVCLNEIHRLQQLKQTPKMAAELQYYMNALAELRREAVYYREFSSIDNVVLLGSKYIRQMKRDLPPLVFQTSILCIKPGKLRGGFYPGLTDSHLYTAYRNDIIELVGYDFEKVKSLDCRADGDLKPTEPICIAFDYNANINWLVAGQLDGSKIKVIKSFYVKYERKLRELVDDFCHYYRFHQTREVIYYYDATALGSNYAVSDDDFSQVVINQFYKNGWSVNGQYLGAPPRHHEKYMIIDQAFKGQGGYPLPLINEHNNQELLVGMRAADVKIGGRTGWEKDKTGEKHAESEEDRLEYRTDGSDGFDTLIVGMIKFPYKSSGSFGVEVYQGR